MRSYLQILAASCVIVTLLAAQSATASTAAAKASKPDGKLIELDEDNWQLMLNGEWMIEFFAPWCPACKNLAPVWERYANTAKDVNVNVAKIDVTTSPSLSGRFFVTALPTIYHVKDGEFRQYRGARDAEALLYFLKKKSWQAIEPLSSWKKPDTIHMSLLSYFFKLSHTLKTTQKLFKDFNARLQEEYGLPTWGSYALFAIATIFVGAALGLMLVCIVDFVYPPKKSPRQSFSESQDNLAKGVEDLATEEIEDDEDDNAAEEEDGNSDDDAEEDQEEEDEEEQETKEETGDKVQAEKKSEKINSRAADDAPEVADKPSTEQVRKRKPRKAD
ncbi:thioredoxin-related transmembrane protein 1 isoform X1 [Drosophila sulfurigaster albostrigata]|uniref:thioredoxin-related transmembrane protein 1 isoform X1 n=1 Tax=Drosophila sulfurigaster albostrigata TaxID=89887 RepID=UPI002D21EB1F|nr:thioredoxin-related transmembrane protein 1 isoform X1 [Drosophila sulfurigaster albostrigata]